MHDTYDIKAAFFDIDGTLTSFVTHVVPQSTVDALRALQAKGVKIFICSGRAPSYMGVVLNTIPVTFDGIVGLNGQYCMDDTGLSYRHPLDQVDVERITAWLDEHTAARRRACRSCSNTTDGTAAMRLPSVTAATM